MALNRPISRLSAAATLLRFLIFCTGEGVVSINYGIIVKDLFTGYKGDQICLLFVEAQTRLFFGGHIMIIKAVINMAEPVSVLMRMLFQILF